MRNYILKNKKTIEIGLVKSTDALEIINYTKTIGGESDYVTFGPEGIPISLEDEILFLSPEFCSKNHLAQHSTTSLLQPSSSVIPPEMAEKPTFYMMEV